MSRNGGPLIPEREVSRHNGEADLSSDDSALSARVLDLDPDEQFPFLRTSRRVPVRRGAIPRKTAGRIKTAVVLVGASAMIIGASAFAVQHAEHSARFRLRSSDNIEIVGTEHVNRKQVMEVMGGDIGRNLFFVPLEARQKQLEQISWVESATLMRFLPNRLGVVIRERTPVAFVRVGSRIGLIDALGAVMDLPPGAAGKYSFPVIVGMGDAEPLSTRAARMNIYSRLISELDAGGAHYSKDLSEVDLSDPEDVKVVADDDNGEVLVHLGASDFASHFHVYKSHIREWRQQFQQLDSVDLRYDGQVIVNPDAGEIRRRAEIRPASLKPALTAAVARKPVGAAARKPLPAPARKASRPAWRHKKRTHR